MVRKLLLLAAFCCVAACARRLDEDPDVTRFDRVSAPPAVMTIGHLQTPESVLYDPDQDVYFISNINGDFLTADDNGFISRVNPNNGQSDLQWIQGGRGGVTLHAPKGMAIVGDTLFVSDLNAVRKFNRRTGAPQGEIPIPQATFINDMTSDGKSVYLSETAIKPTAGATFFPTGNDAIWKITNDHLEKIAGGRDLHQPNGLAVVDGDLYVVTFQGNELYELSGDKPSHASRLPMGQLDGLVHLPNGDFVVTSWQGNAIYQGSGDHYRRVLAGLSAPADIGYDSKRNRLLLPLPNNGEVTVHQL